MKISRIGKLALRAALGAVLALQAVPGEAATPASPQPWWTHAVIYEIYPRSFQDTNGDGIGDLNGVTQRLDYLKELGVDAIWLTPFFPSPNADFGYDVADYTGVAPEYGTMADWDRLTREALAAVLEADDDPDTVVAVIATAGTTNAGIIDDLEGVGTIARERGMWFHVDAAYGGAGMLSTTHGHLFAGMRHVDSFIVDPHKWLFAPFDCAALLYREPAEAAATHTQDASYLDVIHEGDGEWNPTDYAIHLTRRARGMAIWFSLCVYGTDAYAEAVDAGIRIAERAADLIEAADHLELVRPTGLSIVLFRRLGWTDEHYADWSTRLLAEQVGFVTPTKWMGETVARFAFLHPETSEAMVSEILATMA